MPTWAPALGRVDRLRAYFIGGGKELRDAADAGLPLPPPAGPATVASRYGLATRSAGRVRVRFSVAVQGPPPPRPASSAAASGGRLGVRGAPDLRGASAGGADGGVRQENTTLRRRRATAAAMAVRAARALADEDVTSRIAGKS